MADDDPNLAFTERDVEAAHDRVREAGLDYDDAIYSAGYVDGARHLFRLLTDEPGERYPDQ